MDVEKKEPISGLPCLNEARKEFNMDHITVMSNQHLE